MKTLNKFFYALLALATVGMVACTETDTYEPGAPEIESCYDVYFPDAATLETQGPTGAVELDPADATEFTYTAYRNNTEGAVTVPVVVTANTQEKFTVSEIVFEEGSDVAEFTVSLNESEIGVPYTLSFAINDPQYVKQYESANANSISLTVTRVKWNDVGECVYTEDMLNGWYGLGIPDLSVKMQVRADSIDEAAFKAALEGTGSDAGLAGIYRMVNPYAPLTGQIDGIDIYDANVVIYAENVNMVHIPLQEVGVNVDGGAVMIYSMVDYYLDNGGTPTETMYGSIKNGVITFPVDMLLGCPGADYVGSNTYYVNRNGGWTINLCPALNRYELTLPEGYEDGDFTFTEMELDENALFYSESQAAAWYPILEEGRPSVNTDDADRNFVAQYGLMYRLAECYAVDYPIYFGAKADGTVTVPTGFEEQKTGLVQNGYDVYMAIDAKASKFNPETGELALVAEFYTYQGEYIIPYGVYNEVISTEAPDFPYVPAMDLKADFEYTALFTDTFKSVFQDNEWTATLEKGTCTGRGAAAFEKQYGTAYRIPAAYVNGYDIYFAGNADGEVTIPAGYELQPTGVNIYGQQAYIQIISGTVASNGVVLSVKICDAEGKLLMPGTCKESLETYVWTDVATGSWYCNVMKNPVTELTLQHAEDTNLYRVVNFLGVTDKHFVFSWNQETNLCEVQGMNDTGIAASALGVGAPGNIFFADEKTTWNYLGYDDTWESLEADYGASVQPYFDPEENAFVFRVSYFLPDVENMLTFSDADGNKTYFVNEVFVLDGAVSEPKWVEVDTGSYCSVLFTDSEDYYIPFTGRKLMNLENTNKYRIVDFTGTGTDLNFTWDKTTNKCEITGYNDTGVDSTPMGGKGNIFACDVRTYYKENGHDLTWEEIAAKIGGDAQPYFDAEAGEFVFHVILACPELGPSVSLGGGTIFTEYFVLDQEQTASTSSADKANVQVTSSIKGATLKQQSFAKNSNAASPMKLGVAKLSSYPTKEKKSSDNKQTPVKRSRIVEMVK